MQSIGGTSRGARTALLGDRRLELPGALPLPGSVLEASFSIPGARRASRPLLADDLRRGLVLLTTLPNIQKHACIAQITHVAELAPRILPGAAVFHVGADESCHWAEVDRFHPEVAEPGYSLAHAALEDREAFARAFGVGVAESHRIAHGLFALVDGVFLAAVVPEDQLKAPAVERFLLDVKSRVVELRRRSQARLSVGERKRAAFAAALVVAPELLPCDEPTSNLDPVAAHRLVRALEKAAGSRGTTVLWVTHDLHVLPEPVSRLVLLREGHVSFDGSLAEGRTLPHLEAAGLAMKEDVRV